jgi:nuclear transport factor 2 (NTF2) superfamily protein
MTGSVSVGEAARAWVRAWELGWGTHNPDVIAERYAVDCTFRSLPFRPIEHGREAARAYARESFDEERSVRFTFGEPLVADDGRATVEYRAVSVGLDGSSTTIHGVSVLRFGPDGLVAEHRDCWASAPGDYGIDLRSPASAPASTEALP